MRRTGWTLIELLVVLAIISLLVAVSVPVTRMFTRNDLRDASRTIYTLLRAARMYAATYNVEAAVVYSLDYPFTADAAGVDQLEPLFDSILTDPGQRPLEAPLAVRAIRSAAVMYRLPDALNARPVEIEGVGAGDANVKRPNDGLLEAVPWRQAPTFVPAPGIGEFVALPQGYSLLLVEPVSQLAMRQPTPEAALGVPVYQMDRGLGSYSPEKRYYLLDYNREMEYWERWDPATNDARPSLEKIGMRPVHVYPLPMESVRIGDTQAYRFEYDPALIRPMIAHVFNPDGSMNTRLQYQNKERYRLLVAPDPDTYPEERIITLPDGMGGEIYEAAGIIIEINRATGRAKLGS